MSKYHVTFITGKDDLTKRTGTESVIRVTVEADSHAGAISRADSVLRNLADNGYQYARGCDPVTEE